VTPRLAAALALVAVAVTNTPSHAGPARQRVTEPVVVAVIGESGGVNVVHHDFRTHDGHNPRYPDDMPTPVMISLPARGSFATQMHTLAAGPLGRMRPGTLYAVAGTRLLLVDVGTTSYDGVQPDALHATGVADSVTGTRVGTDPDALVVVVLSNESRRSYTWLAAQRWIDLATTSDYSIGVNSDDTLQCYGAAQSRRFAATGRVLFSSAGNTTDQPESLVAPNGLPETYLVGGVDASGNTWLPPHPSESDPFYAAGNVVRPYETGELYSFTAAAPDSLDGWTHFGGTSGATPRTAGWAARLVADARRLLRSPAATTRGALAVGPHPVQRGPLADGRLTRDELIRLLHAVAVPHSALPDGASYALEGYGALNAAAVRHAERVLDGADPTPDRAADDAFDARAHQLRAAYFARCN
jgi:hypothetical protein